MSLASAAATHAQSLTFGEITGTVTDPQQVQLIDAEVRVRDRNSGAIRWMLTARDGAYRFGMLPAGRYDVTVEALGYRPVTHLDVAVAAGQVAKLTTTLRTAALPVTTIDTVRVASLAARPGAWLLERGYADLAGSRRLVTDLAAFSGTADDRGVEGLPWRLAGALVDGTRSSGLTSPNGIGSDGALVAFPVRSAASAEVGELGFDAELGGTGVGVRMTTLRAGGSPTASVIAEGGTAATGASFIAGGPLQGDTALAIFGVDYQRAEVSRPALLGSDAAIAGALASAALNSHATDISAYTEPADRLTDRFGAFGRLDWQPGDRFAMTVRASGSRLTSTGLREPGDVLGAYGSGHEAVAAQAAVSLYGRLSRRVSQEIRVSADIADLTGSTDPLPLTGFAGSGHTIGGLAGFSESRTTPRAAGVLHFDFGPHRLKAGVSIATHMSESRQVAGSRGEYWFGDATDFANASGAWRRIEGAAPAGEFRMSESAIFLQDAWRVADGLDVSLGARLDLMSIPASEIERDAQWLALSGIDNRDVEGKHNRISPRLGFRWELGRDREWLVEGGAGVFQDLPDSRDIAEALTFDRGATARAGVGSLGSWPSAPTSVAAPVVGRAITLLGPEFEGPRTQRLAMSITRRLGAWSSSLSGVYRHTDFLARRRDLNLTAAAVTEDQYGRPIFGTLTQFGTLLAAEPGTNRRFSGFEAAQVLESSGFSDYWGITVGIERVRESGFSLASSYTYSRTTDNVPGFSGQRISPFPGGLGGVDWMEGRSDLDIPHRVLVATEWSAGAMRLGAVYRLSSGLPFTPGVRDGVDANADGDARNDPAFIDPNLTGMTELLNEWDCLGSVPGFVERNACRGELAHRLDLRAAFRIANLTIGRLDLVIDALDVIATEGGRLDHALLLVDRTGAITPNVGGGLDVPYVANPSFGSILADRSPGILWRAGLRIVP